MRAFVVKELAHPSKITLTPSYPEPSKVGDDEVLVDIYSSGVNFFDVSTLLFAPKPMVPESFVDFAESREIPESAPVTLHSGL